MGIFDVFRGKNDIETVAEVNKDRVKEFDLNERGYIPRRLRRKTLFE